MRVSSPKGLKFSWYLYLKGTLNESSMLKSFSRQIQVLIVLQARISSQGDFHNPHYCLSHPRAADICDTLLFLCSILFGTVAFFFSIFPFFCLAKLDEFIWHLIFLVFFCYYKYFPFVCGGRGVDFLRIAFSSCHILHRNANCY